MPDRKYVLENPVVGMYIHYSHSCTSWVIQIDKVTPYISYVYKVNISTLQEAHDVVDWARGRSYSKETWKEFLNKRGCKVEILGSLEPSWEV
ncbi:MAG: hypothetical protein ACW99G_04855 [Candidatus Thorarchaeota archaeon]|jgi:hypothetical protein